MTHPMDTIWSKPPPSWQVCLRNNIKPLNVRKVEGMFCLDIPDRMEDRTDLPYKKTYYVSSRYFSRSFCACFLNLVAHTLVHFFYFTPAIFVFHLVFMLIDLLSG